MWEELLVWKMSSLFRQSLAYVPGVQETMLSAQRQLNSAVVPYVIERSRDWRSLSFLLNADTAELTQSLSIPDDLTDQQIDVLIDFGSRRGNRPFEKLKFDSETFRRIEERAVERGVSVVFQAYVYEIDCSSQDSVDMAFSLPDFATEIEMIGGVLIKLPSKLVKLIIDSTFLEDMSELDRAQHLTNLSISTEIGQYVLKGLPQYLEELTLYECSEFEEGFHYDCSHLKRLDMDANFYKIPAEFLTSISGSLVELFLTDGESLLEEMLRKLTKLEKLTIMNFQDFVFSIVPPWIKDFTFYGKYEPFDPSKPLPNLRRLHIEISSNLEGVLKGVPNLEELELNNASIILGENDYDYEARIRTPPLKSSFPSIKKHSIVGNGYEPGIKLSDSKTFFPNLVLYESLNYRIQDIYADFITKELTIYFKPAPTVFKTDTNLDYVDLNFLKYNFNLSLVQNNIPEAKSRNINIHLPPFTEKISFTIDNKTHTLIIDDTFGAKTEDRKRFFERITFTVQATSSKVETDIELVAKPTKRKLYSSQP